MSPGHFGLLETECAAAGTAVELRPCPLTSEQGLPSRAAALMLADGAGTICGTRCPGPHLPGGPREHGRGSTLYCPRTLRPGGSDWTPSHLRPGVDDTFTIQPKHDTSPGATGQTRGHPVLRCSPLSTPAGPTQSTRHDGAVPSGPTVRKGGPAAQGVQTGRSRGSQAKCQL